MNSTPGSAGMKTVINTVSKDEWRITLPAIEREMERIAGLLQKTIQFESRTSTPHSTVTRREADAALSEAGLACQG